MWHQCVPQLLECRDFAGIRREMKRIREKTLTDCFGGNVDMGKEPYDSDYNKQ